jgi:hypothetical protein
MFSFLNGTVLFAAVAALIPLIIHLFSRRRVKIIEFSSLKHLKAMQRRQVRRLKIRQLLLLILRMLIILIVVLAFARPTTKGGAVGSHASVSAVVLFDNSVSMNRYVSDGNLFEIARKRTKELLATFGQSDQVMMIPLHQSPDQNQAPTFRSAAAAAEQLDHTQVSFGRADLQTALENAARVLGAAANLNREIYIVSDRQRRSLPDTAILEQSSARLYIVDLPLEENDNLGIVSVDFGGQLIQPGLDFNVAATIKNYGSQKSAGVIASLFLDDRRVAQLGLEVDGGQETTVRFTRSVANTGFHSGYVEISDDKFLVDNRYYFSFGIPDKFNVLIIDGDDASRFISLALTPSPELPQSWSVKQVKPEELSGVNFADYDVLVLTGAPKLGSPYEERVKAFVTGGKSVFMTYGGGTDIAYFNSHWSDLTGIAYDEPVKSTFTQAGYYTLQSLNMEHPVFSVFGFEKSKPPEIKFFTLPMMHVVDKGRPLVVFSGDRPALVENGFGSGKVLTFTAPVSPPYTDLAAHAFFVPFVSRVVEYLSSDLSALDTRLYVDNSISRTPTVKGALVYSLQLVTPDTTEYSLPPEDNQGSVVVHAKPTEWPGIYSLRYVGKEVDRFAVNVDPAACDLNAVDMDQFATALGAKQYNVLKMGEPLGPVIAGFRFGRELWQLFMWAALILLAIEMLLSRGEPPTEE